MNKEAILNKIAIENGYRDFEHAICTEFGVTSTMVLEAMTIYQQQENTELEQSNNLFDSQNILLEAELTQLREMLKECRGVLKADSVAYDDLVERIDTLLTKV